MHKITATSEDEQTDHCSCYVESVYDVSVCKAHCLSEGANR